MTQHHDVSQNRVLSVMPRLSLNTFRDGDVPTSQLFIVKKFLPRPTQTSPGAAGDCLPGCLLNKLVPHLATFSSGCRE